MIHQNQGSAATETTPLQTTAKIFSEHSQCKFWPVTGFLEDLPQLAIRRGTFSLSSCWTNPDSAVVTSEDFPPKTGKTLPVPNGLLPASTGFPNRAGTWLMEEPEDMSKAELSLSGFFLFCGNSKSLGDVMWTSDAKCFFLLELLTPEHLHWPKCVRTKSST